MPPTRNFRACGAGSETFGLGYPPVGVYNTGRPRFVPEELMPDLERLIRQELLPYVQNPSWYTGGERNSVRKDLDAMAVKFAFCFPDTYSIGMSHLGLQILYKIL